MDIRPIDVQLTINQASNITKLENKDQAFTQNTLMQMHTYQEKVEEQSQRTVTFSEVNNKTIKDKDQEEKQQRQQKQARKRRQRVQEKREKQKREFSKMSILDVNI